MSTLTCVPWGGSELLWSETALRLLKAGHKVAASVCEWPTRPKQLVDLRQAGVDLNERWVNPLRRGQAVLRPLIQRTGHWRFGRWLARQNPDLVCISSGSIAEDLSLINPIVRTGTPYVLIIHAVGEKLWPNDQRARSFMEFCGRARRCFFVSHGNRKLLEIQLGMALPNTEIVRNPSNVRREAAPPWPSQSQVLRLACIGRLQPDAKGQDLLLRVLASEAWRSRPIEVSFFGVGDMEEGLQRLVRWFQLEERVKFYGHVEDIEGLWAKHHVLVLPSRFEGLPLVIVEAMLCGRPVIVTDVAGNAEIVQDSVTGFVAEAATVHHLNLAMERAWNFRSQWEEIGKAAAVAIRAIMPTDPAEVFAQRLLVLAESDPNQTADRQPSS
ncbi:MAG: glycosyltransferase [Verrucomicrobiae bacterium]|nr:glycosyltransferase [Verrucomicrobiae bacterium]